MNITQLQDFLESNNIPLNDWGKNQAKTLENFLQELNSGQSHLMVIDGKLLRTSLSSVVKVYRLYDGGLWVLSEDQQALIDGSAYCRRVPFSVSKKVFPHESSLVAAQGALREELGIEEDLNLNKHYEYTHGPVSSISYPGILKTNFVSVWSTFMPDHLFKKDGHSKFIWRPYNEWKNC